MTGFTPGPWNASGTGKGVYGHGIRIARMTGGEHRDEANARLIAAAPDMFEALVAAERFLGDLGGGPRGALREAIHAALAKARGDA